MATSRFLKALWGDGDIATGKDTGFALLPLRMILWAEYPLKAFENLGRKTNSMVLDWLCAGAGVLSAIAVLAVVIVPASIAVVATLAISIALTILAFLVSPFTWAFDLAVDFFSKKADNNRLSQSSSSSYGHVRTLSGGVIGSRYDNSFTNTSKPVENYNSTLVGTESQQSAIPSGADNTVTPSSRW